MMGVGSGWVMFTRPNLDKCISWVRHLPLRCNITDSIHWGDKFMTSSYNKIVVVQTYLEWKCLLVLIFKINAYFSLWRHTKQLLLVTFCHTTAGIGANFWTHGGWMDGGRRMDGRRTDRLGSWNSYLDSTLIACSTLSKLKIHTLRYAAVEDQLFLCRKGNFFEAWGKMKFLLYPWPENNTSIDL